jgi:GDPmannose 4,6-dehydratase
MKSRKALIVGCNGQDGTLLRMSLLSKNIEIIGIARNQVIRFTQNSNNNSCEEVREIILNNSELKRLLNEFKPTEVYYLAAHHTSSEILEPESSDEYVKCNNTHVIGLLNILNIIRDLSPSTRLFYASSALVFSGNDCLEKTKETSAIAPIGYYGLTKAQGVLICEYYRRKYSIHISVGHLFNHESHLRQPHYLSHKIISTARRISKGGKDKLIIGNLQSIADWGYAPDFVEAFQSIVTHDSPETFIISTGEARTVEEFVSRVFEYFKLDYSSYVIEDSSIQKRKTPPRVGDPSKLFHATNWRPTCDFPAMITKLINDHVNYYEVPNVNFN